MIYIKDGNKKRIKLEENDIIVITLAFICLVLVLLLFQANSELNQMINMFNEFCYIAPKSQAVNFTLVGV